ncbi:YwqJ-related putative deaminase [Acidovorax sacchari]|uniref:YwqJ-related putative deaminase n=1 Tax=Acidovorax sacchari TaxID=3230736 RepID=UPI0039E326F2
MSSAVFGSPKDGLIGVRNGFVNFGVDAFNGAVNGLKTSLDGYSILLEKSGVVAEGEFAGFRSSEVYNLAPVIQNDNLAQTGGSLKFNVVAGIALGRIGNADLGAAGGAIGEGIEGALIKMSQAFRSNANAADMTFQQAEALKELTVAAYEQMQAAGKSLNSLKPAFTVAQDMVTGQVSFGLNNKGGAIPAVMDETLTSRLDKMPEEVLLGYQKSAAAGSHSEIYAVNELLLARPGAKLSEIAVSTIETKAAAMRGTYKPACPHCDYILNGVHYVQP